MSNYKFNINYKKLKIFEAIDDNDLNELKFWFTKRINKKRIKKHLKLFNLSGQTFLHLACQFGNVKIAKYLIDLYSKNKISLDIKDKNNYTPLLLTAIKGFKEDDDTEINNAEYGNRLIIIKYLVFKGAVIYDIELIKQKENNLMHWAFYKNDRLLSEYLIKNFTKLIFFKNKDKEFPLDLIYKRKEFMNHKEKQNAVNIMNYALEYFYNFLLKNYKSVNDNEHNVQKIQNYFLKKKTEYETNKFEDIVKKKKNRQSTIRDIKYFKDSIKMSFNDSNLESKFNKNLSYWSINENRLEIVLLLLKNKKINLFDFINNYSCFNLLCYKGEYNLIKELLSKKIFFEYKNEVKEAKIEKLINIKTKEDENTNLILAAKKGNLKICNIWLDNNINPFEVNNRGLFAIDFKINKEIKIKCSKKFFELNNINSDNPFLNFQDLKFYFIIYLKEKKKKLILSQIKNLNKKYKEFEDPIKIKNIDSILNKKKSIIGIKLKKNLLHFLAEEMKLNIFMKKKKILERFTIKKMKEFEKFNDIIKYSIILYLLNKEFNIENFKKRGLIINYYYLHNNLKLINIKNEFNLSYIIKIFNKKKFKNNLLKMKLYFGFDVTVFYLFFDFLIWKNIFYFIIYLVFNILLYFNIIPNDEFYKNFFFFLIYIFDIIIFIFIKEYYERSINELKFICDIRDGIPNLKYLKKTKIFFYKTYSIYKKKIIKQDFIYTKNFLFLFLMLFYIAIIVFFYIPFEIFFYIGPDSDFDINFFPILNGLLSYLLLYITIKIKEIYSNIFNFWFYFTFILIIFFVYPIKLIAYDNHYITNNLIFQIILFYITKLFLIYLFRFVIPIIYVFLKKNVIEKKLINLFKSEIEEIKNQNFREIFNENNINTIKNYKENFMLNYNVNIYNILLPNYDILFEYSLVFIIWLEAFIYSLFSKYVPIIFVIYIIIFYFTYTNLLINFSQRKFTADIFQINIFKKILDSFIYFVLIIMITIMLFKTYSVQIFFDKINSNQNFKIKDLNKSPFNNKTNRELTIEIIFLSILELFLIVIIVLFSFWINDKPAYIKESLKIEEIKKKEFLEIKKKNKLNKNNLENEENYKETERNKKIKLTKINFLENNKCDINESNINNLKIINN